MDVQIDQERIWLGALDGEFTHIKSKNLFCFRTISRVTGSEMPLAFDLTDKHLEFVVYQPESYKHPKTWFLLNKNVSLESDNGKLLKRMAKIM